MYIPPSIWTTLRLKVGSHLAYYAHCQGKNTRDSFIKSRQVQFYEWVAAYFCLATSVLLLRQVCFRLDPHWSARAMQANGTCWCKWECPHCTQATSKDLHGICARATSGIGPCVSCLNCSTNGFRFMCVTWSKNVIWTKSNPRLWLAHHSNLCYFPRKIYVFLHTLRATKLSKCHKKFVRVKCSTNLQTLSVFVLLFLRVV